MSTIQKSLAPHHQARMRRAALRNAADPALRQKALRTVGAALDLGLCTLDDVIDEQREARQRQDAA